MTTLCEDAHRLAHNTGSKVCIVCGEGYFARVSPNSSYKKDPNDDKKCWCCVGKGMFNCVDCAKTYISEYDKYGWDRPSCDRCSVCSETRCAILTDSSPPPEDVKDGFLLAITYDVHCQTHDGYCSDPSEFKSDDEEECLELPVWKGITNDDIDRDGTVISDLHGYYDRDHEFHGNGYCGRKTTFSIKSAKVIKGDRVIDLGF